MFIWWAANIEYCMVTHGTKRQVSLNYTETQPLKIATQGRGDSGALKDQNQTTLLQLYNISLL